MTAAPHTVWWLTMTPFGPRCDGCGQWIDGPVGYFYRHGPQSVLCRVCGEREGIDKDAQPSRRLRDIEEPITAALDGLAWFGRPVRFRELREQLGLEQGPLQGALVRAQGRGLVVFERKKWRLA